MATLAANQWGVAALPQMVALGVAASTVRTWVERGRLVRLHRGVYAVGHAALRAEGRWLAAVLACGPGAVLSHRSAAVLWGLLGGEWGGTDVSVPRGRRGVAGLRVHRPRHLRSEDVTVRRGIPTTTPARTLADLRRVLPRGLWENAWARAERQGLVVADGGARLTRSAMEAAFLAAWRAAGAPDPETNVWLTHGGGEEWQADVLFRRERVIVELDDGGHRTAAAFELDRAKDAERQADGYATLRFTERQLPGAVPIVRRVLALRRAA